VVFELELAPLTARPFPSARTLSRQPIVRRDIAVVVDESVTWQAVTTALNEVKPASVHAITLFDVYRGAGIDPRKKSLAILVLIQDTERTLTDVEIDAITDVLVKKLESSFGAVLRK